MEFRMHHNTSKWDRLENKREKEREKQKREVNFMRNSCFSIFSNFQMFWLVILDA